MRTTEFRQEVALWIMATSSLVDLVITILEKIK